MRPLLVHNELTTRDARRTRRDDPSRRRRAIATSRRTHMTCRDAANQAGVVAVSSHESLESLQRKHGPPKGVFVHLAFQNYDPNEGIARGRKVATTRILQAVPGFAQQAAACWEALPPALRGRVVGFHPGLIAVLLGEAGALRDVNLRYDARALAEGSQRGASEAAAREALNDGRSLFEQTLRIARRWAPVAYVARNPLPAYVEGGADKPDVLALSGDVLASWITAWRSTWSEEEREGYESLNFAPDQAERLHAASARVRETQSVVAAFSDTSPITQRELDAQDGRVLHVVDLIQAAFRQAAQGDARVMVPELGELASLYERPAKRGEARGEGRREAHAALSTGAGGAVVGALTRPEGVAGAAAARRWRQRTWAGVRAVVRGTLRVMTIEQLVSAIRSLPVAERLRVIERAAHDVANDVSREALETAPDLGVGVRLIERRGFLVAHSESRADVPEEAFDHRQDREAHAERLWSRS